MDALLERHAAEIRRLAFRRGATRVRVFGSRARGDARPESDVDLLLDLEERCNLMDVAGLKAELEALLGRDVDIVEEDGLRPAMRERVVAEAAPL